VFVREGGFAGQMVGMWEKREVISGLGTFKMLGRAFPILGLILLTQLRSLGKWKNTNIMSVCILVGVLFISQLLISGLRGSRSETMWAVIWGAGIIHFFWRKFTIKFIILGASLMMVFLFVYGIYKTMGREFFVRFQTGQTISELSQESGRTWKGALVGDLSRADVQAYIAYVLIDKPYNYHYKLGATYVGDVLAYIPRWIWFNKWNSGATSKAVAGADVLLGQSGDSEIAWGTSRVFGLAGEAMLNFGVLGVPVAFLIWGTMVGFVRRAMYNWPPGDLRFYLLPMVVNFLFIIVVGDSDNLIYFLLMKSMFPTLVVFMISRRLYINAVEYLQGQGLSYNTEDENLQSADIASQ
jgi:hypothetical protein